MQIQPISNKVSVLSYKGTYSQTENGADYYKTNTGIKMGAIYGGLSLAGSLIPGESIVAGLIGAPFHIGVGAFMDYKRNQKAAEVADYIKEVGVLNAIQTRNDLEISENKHLYYKSNVGAKYGPIIGAVYGALVGFFPAAVAGAASKSIKTGFLTVLLTTGIGTFGGFLMGKINDYFTNKSARNHA